jgi:hypothetical protein
MGILRKNRFKENTPFEVKDLYDEPIDVVMTVSEIYIADFNSFKPFKREIHTIQITDIQPHSVFNV